MRRCKFGCAEERAAFAPRLQLRFRSYAKPIVLHHLLRYSNSATAWSVKGACDLFTASAQKAKDIVSSAFGGTLSVEIEEKRVVRSVAPRKYHVVLDLRVVKTSAQ